MAINDKQLATLTREWARKHFRYTELTLTEGPRSQATIDATSAAWREYAVARDRLLQAALASIKDRL